MVKIIKQKSLILKIFVKLSNQIPIPDQKIKMSINKIN